MGQRQAGRSLRLYPDGRVPEENPFVGTAGARPEIFSYGHRNAQGMAIHPAIGRIRDVEVGPDGYLSCSPTRVTVASTAWSRPKRCPAQG